jgi:hypothetical protein
MYGTNGIRAAMASGRTAARVDAAWHATWIAPLAEAHALDRDGTTGLRRAHGFVNTMMIHEHGYQPLIRIGNHAPALFARNHSLEKEKGACFRSYLMRGKYIPLGLGFGRDVEVFVKERRQGAEPRSQGMLQGCGEGTARQAGHERD